MPCHGMLCHELAEFKLTRWAVINVRLTVVSTVSRETFTGVTARTVHAAATVVAGVLFAFVHIFTAACTYIIVNRYHNSMSLPAIYINICGFVLKEHSHTLPTSGTSTSIRGVVCSWLTYSSPLTWMWSTRNLFDFTVFACFDSTNIFSPDNNPLN